MKRKPCRTAHRKNETNLLFGGVPARSFSALGAILLAVSLLLPALCAGCASPEVRREITYEPMFDTVCSFYAGTETKEEFDGLSDKVRVLLKELNGLFDVYGEGAQNGLKAVNDAAGKAPVKVDHKVLELMRFSLSYAERTGGAFDPVLGAVTLLWKEAQEKGAPPDGQALAEAGTHVGAPLLQIDEENGTLYLSDEKARIDVGAVAKGWAAKCVKELLEREGLENYLLSLGGNVVAAGRDPRTGKPWSVGVRDPFSEGVASSFALENGAAVTSGNYERFFMFEGVRCHHIVDPSTLYPAKAGNNASVTVFTADPAIADILSTALFVLPEEKAEALAQAEGVAALIVKESGETLRIGALPEESAKRASSSSPLADRLVVALLLLAGLGAVFALLAVKAKSPGAETQDGESENEGASGSGTESERPAAEKAPAEENPDAPRQKKSARRFRAKDALLCAAAGLLSLAMIAAFLFAKPKKREGLSAVVRAEGKVVAVLPLDKDAEYEAVTGYGRNLVVVKDGSVRILEADCKGKDCVRAGSADGSSLPAVIACLPHRLTVSVEKTDQ